MTQNITQQITFKGAFAQQLFDLYTKSDLHTAATGAPATASAEVGGSLNAFGGWVLGTNLWVQPGQALLHSWHTAQWPEGLPHSTVLLSFSDTPEGAVVNLAHLGLPAEMAESLTQGWYQYYWNSWTKYLAGEPVVFVPMGA